MKTIKLTQGKTVRVSNRDYTRVVAAGPWHAHKNQKGNWYARHSIGPRKVSMHNFILGVKGVDHIDHDGLNNQRSNLRRATQAQNNRNKRKQRSTTTSRYKGVRWSKGRGKGKWAASIAAQHLGYFASELQAARAYDKAARQRFGKFALLNCP